MVQKLNLEFFQNTPPLLEGTLLLNFTFYHYSYNKKRNKVKSEDLNEQILMPHFH